MGAEETPPLDGSPGREHVNMYSAQCSLVLDQSSTSNDG